eukprot:TRINITY_DN14132_c0_g1_i3.p1 TRINITY_DN14132_c0_g1~~TRINITY_DN14132_c0_g1_i3.p1  ORF type:complete len:258 (+),score=36.57 TRINITY_DN14132_c0_g1_i3:93-866(+)
MMRRPPRSTLSSSSAASDVYKRQARAPSSAERRVEDRPAERRRREAQQLHALQAPVSLPVQHQYEASATRGASQPQAAGEPMSTLYAMPSDPEAKPYSLHGYAAAYKQGDAQSAAPAASFKRSSSVEPSQPPSGSARAWLAQHPGVGGSAQRNTSSQRYQGPHGGPNSDYGQPATYAHGQQPAASAMHHNPHGYGSQPAAPAYGQIRGKLGNSYTTTASTAERASQPAQHGQEHAPAIEDWYAARDQRPGGAPSYRW